MLLVYAHDIVTSTSLTAARSLCLQAEKQWGYGPVKRAKGRYRLVGKSDYAVWYGETEEINVNVVIMEAKRRLYASTGLPQCLAYMGKYLIIFLLQLKFNLLLGIVHRLRKEAGKEDCAVYGIALDSEDFFFLKINNDSKVR
jgi:hypothetical protein